jgi:hypothetical protein
MLLPTQFLYLLYLLLSTMCALAQVVGDLRQTPKGWFLVPVGQLTTQQREYTALHRAAATEVTCHAFTSCFNLTSRNLLCCKRPRSCLSWITAPAQLGPAACMAGRPQYSLNGQMMRDCTLDPRADPHSPVQLLEALLAPERLALLWTGS